MSQLVKVEQEHCAKFLLSKIYLLHTSCLTGGVQEVQEAQEVQEVLAAFPALPSVEGQHGSLSMTWTRVNHIFQLTRKLVSIVLHF